VGGEGLFDNNVVFAKLVRGLVKKKKKIKINIFFYFEKNKGIFILRI